MATKTLLYVPGDRVEMLERAPERGADVIIADLEDAVAPSRKQSARQAVRAWLRHLSLESGDSPEVWVRVNSGQQLVGDVGAVTVPGLSGICLPKTESPDQIVALDRLLAETEHTFGITPGVVAVSPLLESARAVLAMGAIAAAPRVTRLGIGEVDLAAETGIEPGADETEMAWVRSQLVLHSAAADLSAPIGPVWTNIPDLEGLRRSSEGLRRMGYGGRSCIHPAQLPIVRDVFTPSLSAVAAARRLLEEFDAGLDAGQGVITDSSGRMVDEAVVKAARRTLAAAVES